MRSDALSDRLLYNISSHIIINMGSLKGAFSESAFAMVELLVVIAVMAIIATIVLIFLY